MANEKDATLSGSFALAAPGPVGTRPGITAAAMLWGWQGTLCGLAGTKRWCCAALNQGSARQGLRTPPALNRPRPLDESLPDPSRVHCSLFVYRFSGCAGSRCDARATGASTSASAMGFPMEQLLLVRGEGEWGFGSSAQSKGTDPGGASRTKAWTTLLPQQGPS